MNFSISKKLFCNKWLQQSSDNTMSLFMVNNFTPTFVHSYKSHRKNVER